MQFLEKITASLVSPGTLERHETGETAKAILACVEDSEYLAAGAFLPVPPESKSNKHAGHKPSSSYKHGVACHGPARTQRSADEVRASDSLEPWLVTHSLYPSPSRRTALCKGRGGLVLSL